MLSPVPSLPSSQALNYLHRQSDLVCSYYFQNLAMLGHADGCNVLCLKLLIFEVVYFTRDVTRHMERLRN